VGDIRLDNVPEPRIQQPTDAIVRLSQVLRWAVNAPAKAGTLAIIGDRAVPRLRQAAAGMAQD